MNDYLRLIKEVSKNHDVMEPFTYAKLLAKEKIIPFDEKKIAETAAIVLTTPTALFLYDGVKLMIQKIAYAGSHIILWTQGDPQMQHAKCDTSGLLQLAENTTGRIETAAATDKIRILDSLLNHERTASKKHVIFVDDKSKQILRTYQEMLKLSEVEHRRFPHDVMYIWFRKDPATRDILPDGMEDINQLADFIKADFKTADQNEALPIFANSLYLFDFDRTLFDTDKWFNTVQERIVTEILQKWV